MLGEWFGDGCGGWGCCVVAFGVVLGGWAAAVDIGGLMARKSAKRINNWVWVWRGRRGV